MVIADRGDVDVGDLILGESELALDDGHQRRDGEPREEADEERHPAHVERAHLRRREREQVDAGCFFFFDVFMASPRSKR